MKKILCPTDFSPTSNNAIHYAAKLAQVTNSHLTLLNVHSLLDITPLESVKDLESTLRSTADRLDNQCSEISKTFNISCSAGVEPSHRSLSTVIQEKSIQFDLILMGSNGADNLRQFFLGSNTYNALTKSKTPVLIIPEGFLYSRIKRIVYAFDYLRARKLPLKPLIDLARKLDSDVTVLQVMEEAYSKVAENDLKELQFILQAREAKGFPLTYETIRSSEVAKSIDSFILKYEPDVLALCSQQRNFIENIFHNSVIKTISAICSYPVFVFHE
ncbi:MAG TPA: universal stress protein [Chryseosolibacter sp.]